MSGVHEPIGGPVLARILGWSSEDDEALLYHVAEFSTGQWTTAAEKLGVVPAVAAARWAALALKTALRSPWTKVELAILTAAYLDTRPMRLAGKLGAIAFYKAMSQFLPGRSLSAVRQCVNVKLLQDMGLKLDSPAPAQTLEGWQNLFSTYLSCPEAQMPDEEAKQLAKNLLAGLDTAGFAGLLPAAAAASPAAAAAVEPTAPAVAAAAPDAAQEAAGSSSGTPSNEEAATASLAAAAAAAAAPAGLHALSGHQQAASAAAQQVFSWPHVSATAAAAAAAAAAAGSTLSVAARRKRKYLGGYHDVHSASMQSSRWAAADQLRAAAAAPDTAGGRTVLKPQKHAWHQLQRAQQQQQQLMLLDVNRQFPGEAPATAAAAAGSLSDVWSLMQQQRSQDCQLQQAPEQQHHLVLMQLNSQPLQLGTHAVSQQQQLVPPVASTAAAHLAACLPGSHGGAVDPPAADMLQQAVQGPQQDCVCRPISKQLCAADTGAAAQGADEQQLPEPARPPAGSAPPAAAAGSAGREIRQQGGGVPDSAAVPDQQNYSTGSFAGHPGTALSADPIVVRLQQLRAADAPVADMDARDLSLGSFWAGDSADGLEGLGQGLATLPSVTSAVLDSALQHEELADKPGAAADANRAPGGSGIAAAGLDGCGAGNSAAHTQTGPALSSRIELLAQHVQMLQQQFQGLKQQWDQSQGIQSSAMQQGGLEQMMHQGGRVPSAAAAAAAAALQVGSSMGLPSTGMPTDIGTSTGLLDASGCLTAAAGAAMPGISAGLMLPQLLEQQLLQGGTFLETAAAAGAAAAAAAAGASDSIAALQTSLDALQDMVRGASKLASTMKSMEMEEQMETRRCIAAQLEMLEHQKERLQRHLQLAVQQQAMARSLTFCGGGDSWLSSCSTRTSSAQALGNAGAAVQQEQVQQQHPLSAAQMRLKACYPTTG